MVEALVVIPFFMLMLAGTLFMGGWYGDWVASLGVARAQAWKIGVADSCTAPVGYSQISPPFDIVQPSDLGDLSNSPLAALCNLDFGSVTYTARPNSPTTVSGPFQFNAAPIRAVSVVPCNEAPQSGDVAYEHAVEFLWDLYQNQANLPPNAAMPSAVLAGAFDPWSTGGLGGGIYAL